MAVTLRFRPVLFGPPGRPAKIDSLVESTGGQVTYRDREFSWSVAVPLAAVTVEDLPPFHRPDGIEVTILPIQQAVGKSLAEAHRRLTDALAALARQGAPGVRLRSAAPTGRRSA